MTGATQPADPYYAVVMRNGAVWDTNNLLVRQGPALDPIIAYIVERSGVEVEEGTRFQDELPSSRP
ncbi:MAG: hypothetical protein IT318_27370 [Anaerolineales bacterium]|nr:hypothetical protein [Anaerolineales bacterium]